ncbi:Protein CBG26771 [Caenorhabditis briggsae]|uniref:Protein CBG26771 n=1 Tax=Caenorhabditis briggsae TaxID=6238 RepID=B6IEE0_CAEBR|nr:Protein CBG26771 [Caenorhabditis briggsae]CAS01204.1 Protein CBG26771 [Caenorhabditis briggsae]
MCGGPLCEDIYFLFYVAAPRTRAPPPPPAPEAPDADVPEEQAPEAPEVPENQNPAEDVVELPPLIIED